MSQKIQLRTDGTGKAPENETIRNNTNSNGFTLTRKSRGRQLPLKLQQIISENQNSLRALALKYNLSHTPLSLVVHGKRNTRKLINILETEWCLTIEEIRTVYTEDLERRTNKNPVSPQEAYNFFIAWQARKQGVTVETITKENEEALQKVCLNISTI